ncbi:DUF192 domain-containing protein [Cellulomonas dongxiuzhuiae]|uniref:DUF192 domain-containing protein n=1 Tax=Cellulomonas dongxiuzhuiae TaxID=2819979 RepID=UPI001AAFFEDD|nr:DUF192 domain-containing protein [Cellulomonas dongxiuzhuiae]MBO3088540.1 DUF192 domain-containing protein [Cellulomonas dongxiuzhuiae]
MGRLLVDGRDVANLMLADTWARRARGMLGRRRLPEAMWFVGEASVHGMGMTQALDVAQLDADGVVVAVHVLRPFGLVPPRRGAVDVLEAPRGSFERWGVRTGSRVARDDGTGSGPGG